MSEGAWWEVFANQATGLSDLETWLGGVDHPSRVRVRERIAECGYTSVADIGAGLGLDYIGLQNIDYELRYQGVEPSAAMREAAVAMAARFGLDEVPLVAGSIEEIPLADSDVELAYCRHVFEHLPRIEQALNELIRVARIEVIVVFFMRPGAETRLTRERDGLWQNWWSKESVENVLRASEKAEVWFWESCEGEVLLHVYLRDAMNVNAGRVLERVQGDQ